MDFRVFTEVQTSSMAESKLNSAISARWVEVRKRGGTIRCRLAVRGHDQHVEDTDDTFASNPSLTATDFGDFFGWRISALDISTAFLHARITGGNTFVIPPLQFYPERGVLWKLRRAWYCLRNAPRLWQDHFDSVMAGNNFQRMKSDPNLYVHKAKKLDVLCYVDDLMVFGSDSDVSQLVTDLGKDLLAKAASELSEGNKITFLGRQIKRNADSIELFTNCKPLWTPGGISKPKELLVHLTLNNTRYTGDL